MNNNNNNKLARKRKTLIILRGLSGSGKSTLGKEIRAEKLRNGAQCALLSADDFFMKNGEYCWQEDKLYAAHKSCQRKTETCMKKELETIIIDNTNIRKQEMLPYVQLAREYNYFVTIREPNTPWKTDINQLEFRNVHGLNQTQLAKQKQNWYKTTATELWKLTEPKKPENESNNLPVAPTVIVPSKAGNPTVVNCKKVGKSSKSEKSISESDILSLKTNVEKMEALANMHNFNISHEEEGASCTVLMAYPKNDPIFTSSYKGNSYENACANALRGCRPNLFKPKKK